MGIILIATRPLAVSISCGLLNECLPPRGQFSFPIAVRAPIALYRLFGRRSSYAVAVHRVITFSLEVISHFSLVLIFFY